MKHIWVKTESPVCNKIIFRCFVDKSVNKMVLSAGAFYTVYFDGTLVSYGPERAATGYSRIREIPITKPVSKIEVLVFDYGIPSFDKDFNSFFGCEILNNDELIYTTDNFKAYSSTKYLCDSIKYSFQRGFVERFNLKNIVEKELETYEVQNITLIKGVGDKCHYLNQNFKFKNSSIFKQFDEVKIPQYVDLSDNKFNIKKDLLNLLPGYRCHEYYLDSEKSGLIKLSIKSNVKDAKVFVVFDEYLDNGKWIYGRSSCNDLITIDLDEFDGSIITSSVYALKHLRILTNKEIEITPSLILIQNDDFTETNKTGDQKFDLILDAARNTFMQNAVDVFTDCPGRERGGWLCDSYFIGIAEHFFTGKNDIERCFLENYVIGSFEEVEEGMLPMLFPAQEKLFIPNWAMWFVLELEQYYLRTNDSTLVKSAQLKIDKLIHYFEQFENEYMLLENLRGWVFVEWSSAGSEDYIQGVSFATNMLYVAMLECYSRLYKDENSLKKAGKIREFINKYAFDGKLYHDNALRVNGRLEVVKEHTSETCQYYALFFKINNSLKYANFIKKSFGPLRNENSYKEVARSNAFIGNYLRFLWLNRQGEFNQIKKEATEYFYKMASYSGTLWEKDSPTASCNHGFASSIAPILLSKDLIK